MTTGGTARTGCLRRISDTKGLRSSEGSRMLSFRPRCAVCLILKGWRRSCGTQMLQGGPHQCRPLHSGVEVDGLKPRIQHVAVQVLIHHSSPRTHQTYILTRSRFPPGKNLSTSTDRENSKGHAKFQHQLWDRHLQTNMWHLLGLWNVVR